METINAVAEGGAGVKLAVHLCRRAGARARAAAQFRGGYDPILPQLNRLKVHHLTMEFTAPGAGDMAIFKQLREDFEIGLGCVSVTPGQIDAPETIAAVVRQAAKFLAPERIVLNPDCGFAPGSGAVVGIDEAYQTQQRGAAADAAGGFADSGGSVLLLGRAPRSLRRAPRYQGYAVRRGTPGAASPG